MLLKANIMKKLVLISLLGLFLAACNSRSNEAIISGEISNSTVEIIEAMYFRDFATIDREFITIPIDQNGAFSKKISLDQGRFLNVKIGKFQFPLYLAPGSDISVTFDADYPDALPVIKGKGARENSYMLAYQQDIEPENSRSYFINLISGSTPEDFSVAVENSLTEKLSYLNDFQGFSELDKNFVSKLENIYAYERYELLMLFPRVWSSSNPEVELEMPEDYFDFLTDEEIFNDTAANSMPYFAFANEYLAKCVADNEEPTDDSQVSFQNNFLTASQVFSGKTRDAMLAKTMLDMIRYGNFDKASEFFTLFLEKITPGYYKDFVSAEYETTAAVTPGKPAPDFTLEDIDGNPVSMSDFRGKVVYLDFWASWCGPCMRQMPAMKELKKRMEGKDVVFLYISIDEDQEAWRNTVAREEIVGVHLNVAGRHQPVPASYVVRGIPKFYLIGRDGMIIDNVPPRPSNPTIDQAILTALEL
jgi:thiol-disulfide isomerase/thioredoxin